MRVGLEGFGIRAQRCHELGLGELETRRVLTRGTRYGMPPELGRELRRVDRPFSKSVDFNTYRFLHHVHALLSASTELCFHAVAVGWAELLLGRDSHCRAEASQRACIVLPREGVGRRDSSTAGLQEMDDTSGEKGMAARGWSKRRALSTNDFRVVSVAGTPHRARVGQVESLGQMIDPTCQVACPQRPHPRKMITNTFSPHYGATKASNDILSSRGASLLTIVNSKHKREYGRSYSEEASGRTRTVGLEHARQRRDPEGTRGTSAQQAFGSEEMVRGEGGLRPVGVA